MSKNIKHQLPLLHWSAILALILLVLNDHFLKYEYGNWWTGKLSDVAGLYLLGLVLPQVLPSLEKHSFWLSGIIFLYWKLPISEPLVQGLNQILPWGISRVVDYSDLWCLLVLIPAQLYWSSKSNWNSPVASKKLAYAQLSILSLCLMAFSATSPPISYRLMDHRDYGDIQIEEMYSLKGDSATVLTYFEEQGFKLEADTAGLRYPYYPMSRFLVIDTLLVLDYADEYHYYESPDTISGFTFTISPLNGGDRRTQVVINHLELARKEHFADWRQLKRRQRRATKGFVKVLIDPLREWLKAQSE